MRDPPFFLLFFLGGKASGYDSYKCTAEGEERMWKIIRCDDDMYLVRFVPVPIVMYEWAPPRLISHARGRKNNI